MPTTLVNTSNAIQTLLPRNPEEIPDVKYLGGGMVGQVFRVKTSDIPIFAGHEGYPPQIAMKLFCVPLNVNPEEKEALQMAFEREWTFAADLRTKDQDRNPSVPRYANLYGQAGPQNIPEELMDAFIAKHPMLRNVTVIGALYYELIEDHGWSSLSDSDLYSAVLDLLEYQEHLITTDPSMINPDLQPRDVMVTETGIRLIDLDQVKFSPDVFEVKSAIDAAIYVARYALKSRLDEAFVTAVRTGEVAQIINGTEQLSMPQALSLILEYLQIDLASGKANEVLSGVHDETGIKRGNTNAQDFTLLLYSSLQRLLKTARGSSNIEASMPLKNWLNEIIFKNGMASVMWASFAGIVNPKDGVAKLVEHHKEKHEKALAEQGRHPEVGLLEGLLERINVYASNGLGSVTTSDYRLKKWIQGLETVTRVAPYGGLHEEATNAHCVKCLSEPLPKPIAELQPHANVLLDLFELSKTEGRGSSTAVIINLGAGLLNGKFSSSVEALRVLSTQSNNNSRYAFAAKYKEHKDIIDEWIALHYLDALNHNDSLILGKLAGHVSALELPTEIFTSETYLRKVVTNLSPYGKKVAAHILGDPPYDHLYSNSNRVPRSASQDRHLEVPTDDVSTAQSEAVSKGITVSGLESSSTAVASISTQEPGSPDVKMSKPESQAEKKPETPGMMHGVPIQLAAILRRNLGEAELYKILGEAGLSDSHLVDVVNSIIGADYSEDDLDMSKVEFNDISLYGSLIAASTARAIRFDKDILDILPPGFTGMLTAEARADIRRAHRFLRGNFSKELIARYSGNKDANRPIQPVVEGSIKPIPHPETRLVNPVKPAQQQKTAPPPADLLDLKVKTGDAIKDEPVDAPATIIPEVIPETKSKDSSIPVGTTAADSVAKLEPKPKPEVTPNESAHSVPQLELTEPEKRAVFVKPPYVYYLLYAIVDHNLEPAIARRLTTLLEKRLELRTMEVKNRESQPKGIGGRIRSLLPTAKASEVSQTEQDRKKVPYDKLWARSEEIRVDALSKVFRGILDRNVLTTYELRGLLERLSKITEGAKS